MDKNVVCHQVLLPHLDDKTLRLPPMRDTRGHRMPWQTGQRLLQFTHRAKHTRLANPARALEVTHD